MGSAGTTPRPGGEGPHLSGTEARPNRTPVPPLPSGLARSEIPGAPSNLVLMPRALHSPAPALTGEERLRRLVRPEGWLTPLSTLYVALHAEAPKLTPAQALDRLSEGPILDVGAGRIPRLARFLVAHLGFKPEDVHAVDPGFYETEDPAFAPGNLRRTKVEDLPEEWGGRFSNILTFATFNTEIVYGDVPHMGDGIDVERAAEAMHRALKPGGRITMGVGGELDIPTRRAFLGRFRQRPRKLHGIDIFEKP